MTQINSVNSYYRNTLFSAQTEQREANNDQAARARTAENQATPTAQSRRVATSGASVLGDAGVQQWNRTNGISNDKTTAEMTMDEYKSYIREQLSQIPWHPSRNGDYAVVNISEKGFEAMKNDPEYEQWVLDKMKQEFAVINPFVSTAGNIDGVYSFGASKEEYHGFSQLRGNENDRGKEANAERGKDSFWEKRLERHKENMQRSAELAYLRHVTEQLTDGMTDSPFGTPGSGSVFQAMIS